MFATTPAAEDGPAAALPYYAITPLRRLLDQLAALGVGNVHTITRQEYVSTIEPLLEGPEPAVTLHACGGAADDLRAVAAIAREAGGGGVALVHGDVVTGREALAPLVAEPPLDTAIAGSAARPEGAACFPIRAPRSRVLSAGSPYHSVAEPNGWFIGLLRVGSADEPLLVDAAERLARLVDGPLPAGWEEELERHADPATREDVPALVLVALVRAGVRVRMHDVRALPWARLTSREAARPADRELHEQDGDDALLDSAVKSSDGFFTSFFVSPYSKYIARWAAGRGITPNQVTTFSMGLGILAAAAFASGERWGLIAGAILLQAAFTFDCVDGQLARYTRTYSRFGAWLDSIFDRLKEYLVYAGLAIGSVRGFGVDVWPLAAAALTLQTARHMLEFAYWDVHYRAIEDAPQPPLEQSADRAGAGPRGMAGGVSAGALSISRLLDRPPGIHWIKRMAVFPIGERLAAISIAAAVATPRTVFVVLLVWGGVAALYSLAGHAAHSLSRSQVAGRRSQDAFRDDGPLARLLGALLGRLPLSAVALMLFGAVPLVVALAVDGAFLPHWALAPGVATVVLLGGAAAGRPPDGRFDWAAPSLLRVLEYGLLLWTAVLAHGSAVRACFALLAVLAFHHYDAVYRERQGAPPPARWLVLTGGWEARVILAYVALLVAVSTVGMAVAAAVLGIVFIGESAAGWLAAARTARLPDYTDEEELG